MLLNKSLYCMFPDPFLPRVAVRVGKGSGYARLDLATVVSQALAGIKFYGVTAYRGQHFSFRLELHNP